MFYFYDSENSFSSLRLYLDACQYDDSNALFTFAFHYVVATISAALAHVSSVGHFKQQFNLWFHHT